MAQTTLPAPLDAFVEAVNRHDREGFLDAFALDGVVDDWGREFAGREAIAGWSDDEFIGATGTLTVTQVNEQGDDVVVIGDWRSTHANGLSRFTFSTRGDKITRMQIRAG